LQQQTQIEFTFWACLGMAEQLMRPHSIPSIVRVYISVSTCLAGHGVILIRAGALQACFVLLHPCLCILLAIYSEATACMSASAHHVHCSESAQLRSARPTPSSCTFHVPCCMSIFLIYATVLVSGGAAAAACDCHLPIPCIAMHPLHPTYLHRCHTNIQHV
jgi:hypothetical protein